MKIPKSFTQECADKLTEVYPNTSQEEILKEFPQYQWRSLQNIANELGLKREFSSLRKGKIGNLFDGSNESYYWLGLIASDGSITPDGTLKVELAIKDKNYLSNLAKFLEVVLFEYPRYSNSKPGGTGTCRIKIKDIKEGKKLRELFQINEKKTYNPISIDFINTKDQLIAFLGGYIDGDGTISKGGIISIDGHKNMKVLFENINRLFELYFQKESCSYVYYQDMIRINFKSKNSKLIKKEITKLNLPIMQRKWERIKI